MTKPAPPPEIVLVSHNDLARVKELLAEDPSLLNVTYEPWQETPLGAASHVGNREIAEYLLAQGAPMTVCTAAMLGRKDDVQQFFDEDAGQANAKGAHGIPLLYHTAMSGNTEIADLIVDYGGSTEFAGFALHGAVQFGHLEMVEWLLDQEPDLNVENFQGKTPLDVALTLGHEEIAGLLRERGGQESGV